MTPSDAISLLVRDAFWSALAAAGFAVIFNVPRRTLPGCALVGAIGHTIRTLLMQLGLDIELATLIGATIIGFTSIEFARLWRVPKPIFSISASIPLVPGVLAFQTMMALVEVSLGGQNAVVTAALVTAISDGIRTALILGAIALGIAMPNLFMYRQKPVV